MEDIIVSDFDGVLFKKYHGLIQENVDYVLSTGLPVYVVTFRAEPSNTDFMLETLKDINLIGIAFAGDRRKDPLNKVILVEQIRDKYNVVEALDNDAAVVLHYRGMGIPVVRLIEDAVQEQEAKSLPFRQQS